jgi:hypothetical protein
MPRSVLVPLLVLNGGFLVMLVTIGPTYGWLTMVLIGALISAANVYVWRRTRA